MPGLAGSYGLSQVTGLSQGLSQVTGPIQDLGRVTGPAQGLSQVTGPSAFSPTLTTAVAQSAHNVAALNASIAATLTDSSFPPPAIAAPDPRVTGINPAATLQSIIGESHRAGLTPTSNAVRISAPLGSHVPIKIKQLIWADQFIDLNVLISKPSSHSPEDKSEIKKPSQLHIADWALAFQTLTAIVADQDPTAAPGMLKYMSVVQKLSIGFGVEAWRHYDEIFRWAKQFDPTLQWGQTDLELYTEASLMAIKSSVTKPFNPSTSARSPFRGSTPPRRPNTCWPFQRQGRCVDPSCAYKSTHQCYRCRGQHATFQCRLQSNRAGGNGNPITSGPNSHKPPSQGGHTGAAR